MTQQHKVYSLDKSALTNSETSNSSESKPKTEASASSDDHINLFSEETNTDMDCRSDAKYSCQFQSASELLTSASTSKSSDFSKIGKTLKNKLSSQFKSARDVYSKSSLNQDFPTTPIATTSSAAALTSATAAPSSAASSSAASSSKMSSNKSYTDLSVSSSGRKCESHTSQISSPPVKRKRVKRVISPTEKVTHYFKPLEASNKYLVDHRDGPVDVDTDSKGAPSTSPIPGNVTKICKYSMGYINFIVQKLYAD